MEQIFNWLREEIEAHSVEFYTLEIVAKDRVCSLVDAAEAKWKADCCIRIVGKPFTSSCGQKYDKWTYVGEPYCSVCGRRIKINEADI